MLFYVNLECTQRTISLVQKSNFWQFLAPLKVVLSLNAHKTHLEGLSKHKFWAVTPEFLLQKVGEIYALAFLTGSQGVPLLLVQGPHLETLMLCISTNLEVRKRRSGGKSLS